jgi:CRISPR system Cascade subunit CasD
MSNTLFLQLEGPMQAWGERGQWETRDTVDTPTKSGIVGLLACALGWKSDEQLRTLSRQIRIGVRCDYPGELLIDYHTIGGGYPHSVMRKAEGGFKGDDDRPHTEISHRHYLCDASFLVVVQSDHADLITQLAERVQNPYWPIFLGRKSCPPSRPVFEGVGEHESLIAALHAKPLKAQTWRKPRVPMRAFIECRADEEHAVRHRDEIELRSVRRFGARYVREVEIFAAIEQEEEDVSVTSHT